MKRIVKHPRYSQTNYDNDIALVQLDKPVKFEGILNPVCLATPKKSFSGENVRFSVCTQMTEIYVSGNCDRLGNIEGRVRYQIPFVPIVL